MANPRYDIFPEGDDNYVPPGIAGSEFPISLYDRPQLALSNLILHADVDAATRSIFSPQTLSPNEMLTFRKMMLKGRKPNKLLETLLDISTNPLVIIGLVAGLHWPVGSTKPLFEIAEGLRPIATKMLPFMSSIHSAFTNLRKWPELYQWMTGVSRATADFIEEFGPKMNNIFREGGKLNSLDQSKIVFYIERWNKPVVKHIAGKIQTIYPELGIEPLAPGLQAKMEPRLISIADQLTGLFAQIRDKFKPEVLDRIRGELQGKGIKIGDWMENYFPHKSLYNKYEMEAVKALEGIPGRRRWAYTLNDIVEKWIAPSLKRRTGASIPNFEALEEATKAGILRPDVLPTLRKIVDEDVSTVMNGIRKYIESAEKAAIADPSINKYKLFYNKMKEGLSGKTGQLAGRGFNITGRLGHAEAVSKTLDVMARNLFGTWGTPEFEETLGAVAKAIAAPAEYSMSLYKVMPSYLNAMSSTYAWQGTGLGQQIMDFVKSGQLTGWAVPYVEDQLIPHLRGLKSWKSLQRVMNWTQYKEMISRWLNSTSSIAQTIPKAQKDWLLEHFTADSSLGIESMMGQVNQWFTLSTLGGNVSASIKNALQPFITILPLFGAKGFGRGIEMYLPKLGEYTKLRTGGMAHEAAFKQAFPDFVEALGTRSNTLQRAILSGDIMREGTTIPPIVTSTWGKVKQAAMTPFMAAETNNWLISFYTGKANALAEGYIPEMIAKGAVKVSAEVAAGQFGARVVEMTQFPGGALGLPKILLDIPAPLRQFMHFPLRYLDFLTGSVRWGPTEALNLGTIGRTMAGSTALYLAAKNLLGADLSQGLLTGALPLPAYEQAPFFPWPLVPPIGGALGGVAQALYKGEFRPLESTLALMTPGGIMGRRLYKTLSRKYADYENRTQEGLIPTYNEQGSLVGNFTPLQLTLRAIGLMPTSVSAEQGAAKWLLAQRDQLRGYRRTYLQAMTENDLDKADRINRDFQRRYPELGPLQIKKSDITAIKNRRQVSRLDRILRGFPTEYRPLFQQMVTEASLGKVTQDIQNQPLAAEWYMQ